MQCPLIKTKIGTIKVADAKEYYFKKGFVFPSWSEQGDSLDSTLDFVKEKKKYKAIVSYAPNPFSGFHTHAYAKKKGNLVDVGSNMIFFDHTGELLEKGEVIFEKKFADMNMQGLKEAETPKLLQLALQAKKEKKQYKLLFFLTFTGRGKTCYNMRQKGRDLWKRN